MGETAILDREARLAVEVTFEPRRKGCHELVKRQSNAFHSRWAVENIQSSRGKKTLDLFQELTEGQCGLGSDRW